VCSSQRYDMYVTLPYRTTVLNLWLTLGMA